MQKLIFWKSPSMTLHFLASQNTQEVMFLSQSVCQAMLVDFTDLVLASEDT